MHCVCFLPREYRSGFLNKWSFISLGALIGTVGLMLYSVVAVAQHPLNLGPVTVVRDAQGLLQLHAAVTALGGEPALAQLLDAQATGTSTSRFGSGTFLWKDAGWEFRDEHRNHSGDTKTLAVVASGHGNGKQQVGDHKRQLPVLARFNHIPYAMLGGRLLQLIRDNNVTVEMLPSTTLASTAVNAVSVRYSVSRNTHETTMQTWYFDKTTNLPVAIDYFVAEVGRPGGLTLRASLSGYQAISGTSFPQIIDIATRDGQMPSHLVITSVVFNQAPPSAVFDIQ